MKDFFSILGINLTIYLRTDYVYDYVRECASLIPAVTKRSILTDILTEVTSWPFERGDHIISVELIGERPESSA